MSTKTDTDLIDSAGGLRSEPGGRAQQPAGGEPLGVPDAVRERLSDGVIDELLAGARTEEEIVGPGGVLAQLTKRWWSGRCRRSWVSSSATSRTGSRRAGRQHPQRLDAEDACDRARACAD